MQARTFSESRAHVHDIRHDSRADCDYPMPALLIGAVVGDKPTFMTAAWGGIAHGELPMLTVALRPARHTLLGIRANSEFSVNVASASQVQEVDYCGVVSGAKTDKVPRCGLKVFCGGPAKTPLIEQCRRVQNLDIDEGVLVRWYCCIVV